MIAAGVAADAGEHGERVLDLGLLDSQVRQPGDDAALDRLGVGLAVDEHRLDRIGIRELEPGGILDRHVVRQHRLGEVDEVHLRPDAVLLDRVAPVPGDRERTLIEVVDQGGEGGGGVRQGRRQLGAQRRSDALTLVGGRHGDRQDGPVRRKRRRPRGEAPSGELAVDVRRPEVAVLPDVVLREQAGRRRPLPPVPPGELEVEHRVVRRRVRAWRSASP